jgi:hypothetical protein
MRTISSIFNLEDCKRWLVEKKWDIMVGLVLLCSYLVIYRDVVFAPYLITGVDFQIPSTTKIWNWDGIFSPWSSFGNGFPYGTNWTLYGAFANGIVTFLCNGNVVLAQKFFLSSILFSSFFMYLLLSRQIIKNRAIAITGALIYAYGSSTVNYGTGIIWEYAFFPLVLYFMFNLIGSNPKFRDVALFVISFDIMTGYGVHLVPFLPILALIFLLLNLYGHNQKKEYLVRSSKYLLSGIILFLFSAPAFTLSLISFLAPQTIISGGAMFQNVVSDIKIDYFYINYCSIPLTNWFILLGPYGEYIKSIIPIVGYIFPILGFSSLLSRGNSLKKAIGFSTVLVLVLAMIVLITFRTNVFVWLFYNFPLIRLFRGTEGPAMIIAFTFTTLLCITLEGLVKKIEA